MDLNNLSTLSVVPNYIAIMSVLFVLLTMYVGLYRVQHKVDIGDAGDKHLLRRIRCHANFVETVPLAVILLICLEALGASNTLLHSMGAMLVLARVLHFFGLSRFGPFVLRPIGMFGTLTVYLVCSFWILHKALA